MAGTVYLGCGSAEDEMKLWRLMLHRPHTRIVYWPFALPQSMVGGADRWLRGNLDRLGASFELRTWLRLDGHAAGDLDEADVLFVGGGNTFRLLDYVSRAAFLDPVRRFVTAGGDYYGGSAGAVLACDDIRIADGHDPNEPGLHDLAAIGLLNGVSVLPHFTEDQLGSASHRPAVWEQTVLGLPDSTGLIHADNEYRVVGRDELCVISPGTARYCRPGDAFVL